MFVLHPAEAAKDMDAALEFVNTLVTKAGGIMLDCRKWDDRRLAYEIRHQKRGIYVLAHFEGNGPLPNEIYRLAGMSEMVLRALITRDQDGVPKDEEAPEEPSPEPTPVIVDQPAGPAPVAPAVAPVVAPAVVPAVASAGAPEEKSGESAEG